MVRLPLPRLTVDGLRPHLGAGRSALPVVGGALALLLAAGFFVALPDWRLEQLVETSGLPRVLSLAQPPLGHTARLLLALFAGLLAGAVAWSALYLLFGPGGVFHREPATATRPARPSVRRADAHPDAPPRRPLTAAELDGPPPPPPAERGLPSDLDQPLAAFDPAAIPDVPREPVRPVASIVPPAPVVEPEMMPETMPEPEPEPEQEFAPAPAPEPAPEPKPKPQLAPEPTPVPMPRNDDPPPSIAALLDRLERGTRRRSRR